MRLSNFLISPLIASNLPRANSPQPFFTWKTRTEVVFAAPPFSALCFTWLQTEEERKLLPSYFPFPKEKKRVNSSCVF